MGEKKIKRVVVMDLRKGLEGLEKKAMIEGQVTERKISDALIALTLDTGYMVFLHLEED